MEISASGNNLIVSQQQKIQTETPKIAVAVEQSKKDSSDLTGMGIKLDIKA